MSTPRDRTTVRRGLIAGGVAAAVVGIPLTVWAAAVEPSLVIAAVMAALTAGVLLTAGWLLLALGLDLVAGDVPGGGRMAVTAAAGLMAILMPFLLLAAVSPN